MAFFGLFVSKKKYEDLEKDYKALARELDKKEEELDELNSESDIKSAKLLEALSEIGELKNIKTVVMEKDSEKEETNILEPVSIYDSSKF
jgi:hypothetical protein